MGTTKIFASTMTDVNEVVIGEDMTNEEINNAILSVIESKIQEKGGIRNWLKEVIVSTEEIEEG